MIHRTYRSLDDAPKLVIFTIEQWGALIAGTGLVLGVIHLTRMPTKPAISLCVFLVGVPAAMTYVSEGGGVQLNVLLWAMCTWRLQGHSLLPAGGSETQSRGLSILGDSEPLLESPGDQSAIDEDAAMWERWG